MRPAAPPLPSVMWVKKKLFPEPLRGSLMVVQGEEGGLDVWRGCPDMRLPRVV